MTDIDYVKERCHSMRNGLALSAEEAARLQNALKEVDAVLLRYAETMRVSLAASLVGAQVSAAVFVGLGEAFAAAHAGARTKEER